MTSQAMETIIFEGQELSTYSQPLNSYPKLPKFYGLTTMLRRGYRGTWEVRGDRLYLISLYGNIEHPSQTVTTYHTRFNFETNDFEPFADTKPTHQEINLNYLFPDAVEGGVFADWFTGEIDICQGEMIFRAYHNQYEEYLTLKFENGVMGFQTPKNT